MRIGHQSEAFRWRCPEGARDLWSFWNFYPINSIAQKVLCIKNSQSWQSWILCTQQGNSFLPYFNLILFLFYCFLGPGSTGMALTLHQKCDLKFRLVNNYIQKKGSDLCVQPSSRRDTPVNNEEIVLDNNCDSKMHEFYFVFVEGNRLAFRFHSSKCVLICVMY